MSPFHSWAGQARLVVPAVGQLHQRLATETLGSGLRRDGNRQLSSAAPSPEDSSGVPAQDVAVPMEACFSSSRGFPHASLHPPGTLPASLHLPPHAHAPRSLAGSAQTRTRVSPKTGLSPGNSLHPGVHCSLQQIVAGEQHWHPHVVAGISVCSQPKPAVQRGWRGRGDSSRESC